MLPPVSSAALASRVGAADDDPSVAQALEAAIGMLAGRVDEALCWRHRGNWDEAALQLGVKVWDTRAKGTNSLDAAGQWVEPPAQATAGMWRAVLGVLQPCLPTGGLVAL